MQGKQAKMVSPTQERALLGYLVTTRYPARDRVMFLLSMKAGLRAKDMAALTWAMVTDAQGQIAEVLHVPNRASKGRTGDGTPAGRGMADAGPAGAVLCSLTAQEGATRIPDSAAGVVDGPPRHTGLGRGMKGTQCAQFSTEVLQRGAAAVLPQHLPDRWLDALLEEADLFAPGAGDPEEGDRVDDGCAGLLGAVLVVLMEQRGHPDTLEVTAGTLMRHLHCSIVALAAERVSRDTAIWVEPPTLANIFDAEREVRARRRGPAAPLHGRATPPPED
jgi:hypothetical protein